MITGALVLPETIVGMIDASTTRSPASGRSARSLAARRKPGLSHRRADEGTLRELRSTRRFHLALARLTSYSLRESFPA
jgi:hypothetical protein